MFFGVSLFQLPPHRIALLRNHTKNSRNIKNKQCRPYLNIYLMNIARVQSSMYIARVLVHTCLCTSRFYFMHQGRLFTFHPPKFILLITLNSVTDNVLHLLLASIKCVDFCYCVQTRRTPHVSSVKYMYTKCIVIFPNHCRCGSFCAKESELEPPTR